MNAPHISLSSLPSLCQKFSRLKFDKVLTKIISHSFWTRYRHCRHGAYLDSQLSCWGVMCVTFPGVHRSVLFSWLIFQSVTSCSLWFYAGCHWRQPSVSCTWTLALTTFQLPPCLSGYVSQRYCVFDVQSISALKVISAVSLSHKFNFRT